MTNARRTATAPSDLIAEAVKEIRKRRGFSTAAALARHCRAKGAAHLTTDVIANIESGRPVDGVRRRQVTIEELLSLALVLDVSPLALLLPNSRPITDRAAITDTASANLWDARRWIRGQEPLAGQDVRTYFTEQPHDEYRISLDRRRRHTKSKTELAEIDAELAAYEAAFASAETEES